MKISPNHRLVLHKSWKKHLVMLSGLLTGVSAIWGVFMGEIPMWLWISGGLLIPVAVSAIQVIDGD